MQGGSELVESPITDIIFDIDNTLVVVEQEFVPGDDTSNMSPTSLQVHNKVFNYNVINLEAMKLIFAALLRKGIAINFITLGMYKTNSLMPALEKLYDLPIDSLKNSKCINRFDFGAAICVGDSLHISKSRGAVIRAAQDAGWISAAAKIVVVDDHPDNIISIETHGYKTITAFGYPQPPKVYGSVIKNNLYLRAIIETCGLDVELPAQFLVTRADEQLVESAVQVLGIKLIAKWSRKFDIIYFLQMVQKYQFNLSDLTQPNAHGASMTSIAIATRDVKLIQALLITLDTKPEELKTIVLESKIRDTLYSVSDSLTPDRLFAAISRIENAQSYATEMKNSESLIFGTNYTQKGYFDPALKKLQLLKKSYMNKAQSLALQYTNQIIAAALSRCEINVPKTLLERHLKRLSGIMLHKFTNEWGKFNDKTNDELQPFFDKLIKYIGDGLLATTFWKRWGNWSSAGLYLRQSATVCVDIETMFNEYTALNQLERVVIPIPLPIVSSGLRYT